MSKVYLFVLRRRLNNCCCPGNPPSVLLRWCVNRLFSCIWLLKGQMCGILEWHFDWSIVTIYGIFKNWWQVQILPGVGGGHWLLQIISTGGVNHFYGSIHLSFVFFLFLRFEFVQHLNSRDSLIYIMSGVNIRISNAREYISRRWVLPRGYIVGAYTVWLSFLPHLLVLSFHCWFHGVHFFFKLFLFILQLQLKSYPFLF